MATIHRLFIEADLLKRRLEQELILSYHFTGDTTRTVKIDKALTNAERRKARRHQALTLDTINRATSGRNDSFKQMMESYAKGQI